MVSDVVVSLVTYFVAKYASPAVGEDVLKLVLTLQPVILFVILSITVQNVAGINAAGQTTSAKITAASDVAVAKIEEPPTQ